jgi:gliding motility-associated-like protein
MVCPLWGQPVPVAHYPFAGDLLDISGNANHGTAFGPQFIFDRLGRSAQALAFDGIDDYLVYENAANFQPSLPVTLSVWVRIESYQPNAFFYNNWREDVYQGLILVCNESGQILISYGDGGSIGPAAWRSFTSERSLDLGLWYHVAAVIRGPEDMSLYLNGQRACGSYGGLGQEISYDGADGRSGQKDQTSVFNSPIDHLHGALDDLRLYDQALEVEEIRALLGESPPEPVGFDTSLCIFDTLRLPTPEADQYQWSPAAGLSCSDCPNPAFFPAQSTTYRLITATETGCRDTFTYRFEVFDCCRTLTWSDLETTNVACQGESEGELVANARLGTPPYEFALAGGAWQSSGTFSGLSAGTYRVQLRDAEGCLRDTLIDLTQPEALRIQLDSLRTVPCSGAAEGAIFAQAQGGTPPYQSWLNGEPGPLTQVDLNVGVYALQVQDAEGCVDSLIVRVTGVDGLFTVFDQIEGPLCVDLATGQARAQTTGGTAPFLYGVEGSDEQPGPMVYGLRMGVQEIFTRDQAGCQIRQRLTVVQSDTLLARVALANHNPSQPILLSQAQVQFLNQSENAAHFEWELGDQGASSLARAPAYTYREPGNYEVVLTAFDASFQCVDRDTLQLLVIADGRLFLPNAFTPNQDGHNDRFVVRGEGIRQAQLWIFDRWGREIWRTEGMPLQWSGHSQGGQPVPEGVYAYRLRATFNGGQRVERSGTVMLLR